MARTVDWWSARGTTIAGIAAAAARANVLSGTSDSYMVGRFDFGDGGELAPILAPGSMCAVNGSMWLIYPGGGAHEGWLAGPATDPDSRDLLSASCQVGTVLSSAEEIVEAFLRQVTADAASSAPQPSAA